MRHWLWSNRVSLLVLAVVFIGTSWAVRRFHRPGQLDVLTVQAMDMSQMRPPPGAAPVALAVARRGSLGDTVTYTGSVVAYNSQEISPRVTGRLVSLPVYPGDRVRAGQIIARLDTAELSAKTAQEAASARNAAQGVSVARLGVTQADAAAAEAQAKVAAARQAVADAQAQSQAAQDAVTEARAGVASAQANVTYWQTEVVREKQLLDEGAVAEQTYQKEAAQGQAAQAALQQAKSKVRQAQAQTVAARARIAQAQREVIAAQAGERAAKAARSVAAGQVRQQAAARDAAQAAARAASVVQGYTQIAAPANGVVTARPVAPGTLVQPGTVILNLAEIGRVRLQAHVAADDLAGIHIGSPVQFSLPGDAAQHWQAAHVTALFPAANAETRTAVVEAVVPNPSDRLLPGAFVRMRIVKHTVSTKTLVPANAIVTEGGSSFVWVARGKVKAATVYECVICHIRYTAAQARKFHYKDPMDGGKLVPVQVKPAAGAAGLTAHRVTVTTGASDGQWTEISSGAVAPGDRIITQGQMGLAEGVPVIETPWGATGPKSLPTAAEAAYSVTRYRCEKCGMTYSAEDAKKNGYIDPMDGGRLVPVKPAPSGSMPGMKM